MLGDGGAGDRVAFPEDPPGLVRRPSVERLGLIGPSPEELDQAEIGQRGHVIGMLGAPGAADSPLVFVGERR